LAGAHDDEHGYATLLERRLAANEDAPRAARAMVTEVANGLDETCLANLYLAISELVTNAVVHGTLDDVTVRIEFGLSCVRVEVTDTGIAEFELDGQPPDRIHGLQIVEAFTDRCGIDHQPNTVVWCEVDLP
jgi:anti-sigma regulatory factor (Ser/Thr protein kinase)